MANEKIISKGPRKIVPNNPLKTLKRLFKYYSYYKVNLVLGILLIIGSTIAQVLSNGLLSPIVDSIVKYKDYNMLKTYLIYMGILAIVTVIGLYFGNLLMAKLAQKIIYKIRGELSVKIQELPLNYYDKNGHGQTMSSFTNDMDQLTMALEQSIAQIISTILTVFGTLLIMLLISPLLTLVAVILLVCSLFIIKYIGGISSNYFRKRQSALGLMNAYVEEMFSSVKVVKVFNYEDRAQVEFDDKNEELKKTSIKSATFGVMLMPLMGNFSFIQYAIVALIGGLLVVNGKLSIGNITAFLESTRQISKPVTMISNQMNSILAAIAGAERIFSILDLEEENMEGEVHIDKDKKNWILKEDGKLITIPVKADIVFENVDFSYVKGKKILNDISLYANSGQKIAFVGSTGAGKTTITNLINRFYEIEDGKILIDGIDIRKIDKFSLRSIMSMVLQDIHLFNGSIKENIRYGNLNATDEEIIEAAKLSNAHNFIISLKDGYDTIIENDGGLLSQGERQLISIARAAVADPKILILDEATSSIDTRTEHLIEKGMDKLMSNRTTFIIAHRLSTVRHSNAIIVLEKGNIIERGDHEALMNLKGKYYSLNEGKEQLQ